MDDSNHSILVNLILDVKKDVSDLKVNQIETKEIAIKNTVVLEEHIRRTSIAEQRIEMIQKELVPIKEHVQSVRTITKFSGGALKIVGIIVSLVATIWGIIHHLH